MKNMPIVSLAIVSLAKSQGVEIISRDRTVIRDNIDKLNAVSHTIFGEKLFKQPRKKNEYGFYRIEYRELSKRAQTTFGKIMAQDGKEQAIERTLCDVFGLNRIKRPILSLNK